MYVYYDENKPQFHPGQYRDFIDFPPTHHKPSARILSEDKESAVVDAIQDDTVIKFETPTRNSPGQVGDTHGESGYNSDDKSFNEVTRDDKIKKSLNELQSLSNQLEEVNVSTAKRTGSGISAFENTVDQLISKVDFIESWGSDEVRAERKKIILRANQRIADVNALQIENDVQDIEKDRNSPNEPLERNLSSIMDVTPVIKPSEEINGNKEENINESVSLVDDSIDKESISVDGKEIEVETTATDLNDDVIKSEDSKPEDSTTSDEVIQGGETVGNEQLHGLKDALIEIKGSKTNPSPNEAPTLVSDKAIYSAEEESDEMSEEVESDISDFEEVVIVSDSESEEELEQEVFENNGEKVVNDNKDTETVHAISDGKKSETAEEICKQATDIDAKSKGSTACESENQYKSILVQIESEMETMNQHFQTLKTKNHANADQKDLVKALKIGLRVLQMNNSVLSEFKD